MQLKFISVIEENLCKALLITYSLETAAFSLLLSALFCRVAAAARLRPPPRYLRAVFMAACYPAPASLPARLQAYRASSPPPSPPPPPPPGFNPQGRGGGGAFAEKK